MPRPRFNHFERLHACAGVLCERHERCARYWWVDGTLEPSAHWLGTCAPYGSRNMPGFIDVDFVGPPAPRHYTLTRATLHPQGRGTVDRMLTAA